MSPRVAAPEPLLPFHGPGELRWPREAPPPGPG